MVYPHSPSVPPDTPLDNATRRAWNAVVDESGTVSVKIDLDHVRRNALNVARRTGVGIYAVVKADAYGLGARSVAAAVGDIVRGFCVFRLGEARRAGLWDVTRKPTLALGPPGETTAEEFIREHVRPAVSTIEDARRLRSAGPVLSVDTGMQRFACPPEYVPAALDAGACREAFTHAISLAQVDRLVGVVGGRGLVLHAAASKLLDEPAGASTPSAPGWRSTAARSGSRRGWWKSATAAAPPATAGSSPRATASSSAATPTAFAPAPAG